MLLNIQCNKTMMLRHGRVRVIPYRKSNYDHTKHEKIKSKRMCRCKCKTEENQSDFLGMNKFKDKSTSLLYKLIWFIVIICCLTGCILQISIRVMTFLDEAVVVEVKLTQRTSVIFPSITACNLNLFHIIFYSNENKSNEDIDHFNTNQFWSRLGMNSADILIKIICADALRESCEEPVTESMLVEFLNTMLGRCIMLAMKSKMDFRGLDTYASFIWSEKEKLNNYFSGLLFFLHQDTFHHVYDGYPLMEYASVGYSTEYRTYSKKLENLNTYQNPCMSEELAHACLNDCINKEMLKISNCGLPFINNSNLKQCTSIKQIEQNYIKMFPVWYNTPQYYEKCSCHRKCNEMQYVLIQNDKTEIIYDVTTITVLIAGDKDELIIEKQMLTAAALFSDIGGTLGLYLGISVVAIIDFLENLIKYSIKHFNKIVHH